MKYLLVFKEASPLAVLLIMKAGIWHFQSLKHKAAEQLIARDQGEAKATKWISGQVESEFDDLVTESKALLWSSSTPSSTHAGGTAEDDARFKI